MKTNEATAIFWGESNIVLESYWEIQSQYGRMRFYNIDRNCVKGEGEEEEINFVTKLFTSFMNVYHPKETIDVVEEDVSGIWKLVMKNDV